MVCSRSRLFARIAEAAIAGADLPKKRCPLEGLPHEQGTVLMAVND